MLNPFDGRAVPLSGPATDLIPITPNSEEDLPRMAVALYVETGGALTFITAEGRVRTINLPDCKF